MSSAACPNEPFLDVVRCRFELSFIDLLGFRGNRDSPFGVTASSSSSRPDFPELLHLGRNPSTPPFCWGVCPPCCWPRRACCLATKSPNELPRRRGCGWGNEWV